MATDPDMQRSGLGKNRLMLIFAAIAILAAATVFIVVMILGNGQDDQHEPEQRSHAITGVSTLMLV
jgi:flagellar basal body-associated protein FliL